MTQQTEINDDIFGKHFNGTLDLSIGENIESQNNKCLNISIDYTDFDAIYVDALRSKNLEPEIYKLAGHDFDKLQNNRNAFQKHFPNYSLLAGYYDMYEDYTFNTENVTKLRDECLKIRECVTTRAADLALRKLLYGCEAALKNNLSLLFICD